MKCFFPAQVCLGVHVLQYSNNLIILEEVYLDIKYVDHLLYCPVFFPLLKWYSILGMGCRKKGEAEWLVSFFFIR